MICYPETDGNIEGRGETILTVSRGASHKAFPKIDKLRKHHWLEHKICHGFKVHDLITCESKVEVVVSPGKSKFCFLWGFNELRTRDMFSSNGKTSLSWEV